MTKILEIDEGHWRFFFIILSVVSVAVVAYIHWNSVLPIITTKFSLTLSTYGYYALIWVGGTIAFFFIGNFLIRDFDRERTLNNKAKEGRLGYKTGVKKFLNMKISKNDVKTDVKNVKRKIEGLKSHRMMLIIGAIALLVGIGALHWLVMMEYTWPQVRRFWWIFGYEMGLFSIGYLICFLFGIVAYLPMLKKVPMNYSV